MFHNLYTSIIFLDAVAHIFGLKPLQEILTERNISKRLTYPNILIRETAIAVKSTLVAIQTLMNYMKSDPSLINTYLPDYSDLLNLHATAQDFNPLNFLHTIKSILPSPGLRAPLKSTLLLISDNKSGLALVLLGYQPTLYRNYLKQNNPTPRDNEVSTSIGQIAEILYFFYNRCSLITFIEIFGNNALAQDQFDKYTIEFGSNLTTYLLHLCEDTFQNEEATFQNMIQNHLIFKALISYIFCALNYGSKSKAKTYLENYDLQLSSIQKLHYCHLNGFTRMVCV